MRHYLSAIGLMLGLTAVGIAAFETHLIASVAPPPEQERSIKDLAVQAGKAIVKDKVLKDEARPPQAKPFHPVRITYTLLGLAAIGLGVFSWIKKEHVRMSGAAVALGLMAVAWQWVLVGVVVAIVILVLANLAA